MLRGLMSLLVVAAVAAGIVMSVDNTGTVNTDPAPVSCVVEDGHYVCDNGAFTCPFQTEDLEYTFGSALDDGTCLMLTANPRLDQTTLIEGGSTHK